MDNIIFRIIDQYRKEYCKDPREECNSYECSRAWAVDELQRALMDQPFTDPEEVLFNFNMTMRMYELDTKNNFSMQLAFGVATEVSEQIANLYSKEVQNGF